MSAIARLALVGLLAVASPARATGPSQATVRIVPIAVSAKGVVLFKTWRELNPEGAHAALPAELGWLAVDADGLWREVPHAAVGPEVARDDAPYYRLLKESRAAFDWKNPPASVRPLLLELGIGERERVAPIRRFDPTFGFVDVGYDLQCIDAIAVLPKALR